MSASQSLYQSYKELLQQIADIKYAGAVLQWDQETYLPPKGGVIRGRQIATLTQTAHEQFTSEKTGSLLHQLAAATDLTERQQKNVQLSLEEYNKAKKFTGAFVRQMSETVNKSFHAWIQARKENSFAVFEKDLDALLQLKKQEADILGYEHHPYNALLHEFDKGLTVAVTDKVFADLQPQLSSLLAAVMGQPQVDDSFLHQHYNKDSQWQFGMEILKRIHFDFEAGRQDISEHPFTTNFNNADVRVTTRIDENDFTNMTWSCIHEGGHALYEQGLPAEEYGLPLGEYCSLSIHESQSRLWENNVGRSLPFWEHNFSLAQSFFPKQLGNIDVQQFYKAINKVMPSPIRTEADELTYHFHVMIRYQLEKMLIEGTVKTHDIPVIWNELYQKQLGIKIADDKTGCLQDVHWSHGSFGYFATYSLGSLYAAQLHAAITMQNASVVKETAAGNTNSIWQWLQKNIYASGKYHTSEMLCKAATGETLNSNHFIRYAHEKYKNIYNIKME
jgi:carboxypeptidase Taq